MKDKHGYEIPDKANIMSIKSGKYSNPDNEKILETANILIDRAMETFPTQPAQAINVLLTASEYYFVREIQNQIERHERGELPMYQTMCATMLHAKRILSVMSSILDMQLVEIMDYIKDKPELTRNEMRIILEQIEKDGMFTGKKK